MSSLPPINLTPSQPAGPSGVTNLLTALGQLPQMQRDEKAKREQMEMQKLDLQVKKQGLEQSVENQKLILAKGRMDMLKQTITADPTKAKDPQYIAAYQKYAADLGIPANLGPDGGINVSQFQKPFSDISEADKIKFAQMPRQQRAAALKDISGVPTEFLSADAYVTNKDEAALKNAEAHGLDVKNKGAFMDKRAQIAGDLAKAQETYDYAKVANIQNNIKLSVDKLANETRNSMSRAQQAEAAVQTAQTRAEALTKTSGVAGQRLAEQAAKDAFGAIGKLNEQIDTTEKAYNDAMGNNADPDDPNMKQLSQQIDSLKSQREKMQTTINSAQQTIYSNLGVQNDLKAASGVKNVDVTNVGKTKSKSDVQRAVSKSGRPIVSTDGGVTWSYGD